jgi:RNA polymerase sporulation-specific sigma factor
VESLHRVIYQGDGSEIELMDRVEDEKNEISRLTDKLAVEELLSRLEGDERTIIYMRYYQEKTQSEVAEMLDISQVSVSRMEKRIIGKMRNNLNIISKNN